MKGDNELASKSRGELITEIERLNAQLAAVGVLKHPAVSPEDFKETDRLGREVESAFRRMLDGMSQLAWMANPDGFIHWYNRRWYEYTNTSPEQMAGWGWQTVHDPAALPKVLDEWRSSIASGEQFEMEFPLKGIDGIFRWFLTRAMPLKDDTGKVIQWFGTNTDIDQLRRAEAAVRAAVQEREQLLEAERAARSEAERQSRMKDEFLATLGHELRTPLNAILGWSTLLSQSGNDESELRDGLSVIERNARVQTQIIEDLLDMSRIVSGKVRLDVQRVDLIPILEAAIEVVQHAANAKGIRIEKIFDPLAGPVRGDPARLQQVAWNLLNNAVKFTDKGGKIQVLLERVNSHVEVTVSDNGQGIKPEFLPYVFDKFRQADQSTTRRTGGLGLGLAIVKQLVELHGGHVRAKSPGEGNGTTFTVVLPLPISHGDHEEDRQHPTAGRPRGMLPTDDCPPELDGIHILVVDDEADTRDLAKRILEQCGATVYTAASANEADAMLDSHRFNVLVSDIGMPGRDGFDLIQSIRRRPADRGGIVPAVAVTAFARSEDRRRALTAGFDMHVAKPVEPAELLAVVARLAQRGR